ncbi:DDE-type integrase/transposase/recombinase [Spiroplasma sp. SV19]|nr:DDE-type integrase/transposase/recombinase [Spiroplasma sp. SV19]
MKYSKKALKRVENKKDLNILLYLDQASVYTCEKFREFCHKNKITLDFSRKGNPYDNTVKESKHNRLKCEAFYPNINKNIDEIVNICKKWDRYSMTKRVKLYK